ncbi:penicillin-binding protein activator [Lysobacter sp. H23M47]|uniref:penicillin-binding protein activator n=1 Tax=Lysobacter sp. H23M47 TaxID=2781024 RepID=UPI00187F7517|nr:penicillin-binding protein activator [Lysobacter sp. H23M47]QOW24053.1 penicillin-binding protein activator [Lysobacter sp. H23M47]
MNAPTRRLLHAWFLALATAALLVGGCTTMEPVRGPSVSRVDPVVSQAAALLAGGADAQQVAALLGQLDDATLAAQAAALPEGDPLYNHMARALLARGLALPRPMDRAAWGFDADGRPPADRDGYRPPVKLGVLLPLSGDMAAPAAAVRDGFLTAYYAESRRRPDIAFYDTHGTAGGHWPPTTRLPAPATISSSVRSLAKAWTRCSVAARCRSRCSR